MDAPIPAGTVVTLSGEALAVSGQAERELAVGSTVFQGETIVTRAASQVQIDFNDETSLSQGENSQATIDTFVYHRDDGADPSFLLKMTQGVFRTVTGEIARQNPDQFKLQSPMALIGIRGTVVNSEIHEAFEKIGVETIGKGHVLVVQDSQGNIQFISDPLKTLDILQNQPLGPPRAITRQELNQFQTAAPNGVDDDPARQAELNARLDMAEAEAALEEAEAAAREAEEALENARNQGDDEALDQAQEAADQAREDLEAAQEAARAAEQSLDTILNLQPPEEYEDPGEDDQAGTGQTGFRVIGLVESDDQGNLNFYQADSSQEGGGATPAAGNDPPRAEDDPQETPADPVVTETGTQDNDPDNVLVNTLGGESGFGESSLARSDDGYSGEIDISSVFPDGLYLYGQTYTSLFINTNGNLSFDHGSSDYSPEALNGTGSGNPVMIAPFWADVETYGSPTAATPGGNSTGTNRVYYDLDTDDHVLTVTWDDVGYYNNHTDRLNAFQVQIVDAGDGDFDILFRYEDINWNTGDIYGIARIGISAWDGTHYLEIDPSGQPQEVLDLDQTPGTSSQEGYWEFAVRDGQPGVSLTHDLYDDTLSGTSSDDVLRGLLGDDDIRGGSGTDLLLGEGGDDTLDGQAGADILSGGPGTDTFILSDSGAVDTIRDFSGDRIRFDETGLGTTAQGAGPDLFGLTGGGLLDPAQYRVIGVNNDQVQDSGTDPWSDAAAVINAAITAAPGQGSATYFIVNNGTQAGDGDARLYFWEDDPQHAQAGKVDTCELVALADLEGISLDAMAELTSDSFQFA